MWQVCYSVFVVPLAIVLALALVDLLIYGGKP
jgi:hypothetical protein